jgi:hypothetical protein
MTRCYRPLTAYRDLSETETKSKLIFTSQPAPNLAEVILPCGKCIGCRLNHAENWAVRMMHEKDLHDENSFITLTYDDEHLPHGGTLQYDDVTKFIKRLRKVTDKNLSYYYSGEYGDSTKRPHYHMILFGTEFNEPITYKGKPNEKSHHYTSDQDHKFYTSTLLTDLWGKGHADFSNVSYDTCMYVAKYITKKINISHLTPDELKSSYIRYVEGEEIQVAQEQARMSRKPAIGKKWLETYWSDVYNHDYCVIQGKKLRAPKYYDKWLEGNNPDLFEKVKESRESFQKEIDKIELNRSYEFSLKRHENHVSSTGEKSKIPELDKLTMLYTKEDLDNFHLEMKLKRSNNNRALSSAVHDNKD